MVDITAKRGPIDPNDYINDQGIGTQAVLNDINAQQEYRRKKRLQEGSTWDQILKGTKSVVDIGKGVMDIANSYEDLNVKEEAIEKSKVERQKIELNMEKTKQQMKYSAIKNDLALAEYRQSNSFTTDFNNLTAEGKYNDLGPLVLSNLNAAKKHPALLLDTAKELLNLDENKYGQVAYILRKAAKTDMSLSDLSKVDDFMNMKTPELTASQIEYKKFKDRANALQSLVFRNANNKAMGVSNNPNLILSNDIGDYALQGCVIEDGGTQEQIDAFNEFLRSSQGGEQQNLSPANGGGSTLFSEDKNKKDKPAYFTISCKGTDPTNPNKFGAPVIQMYNPKTIVELPIYDKYGNETGKTEKPTLGEVVSYVTAKQEQARAARNKILYGSSMNQPTTTTKTEGKEQPEQPEQTFETLSEEEQKEIINKDEKTFDEVRKDLSKTIEEKSNINPETGKSELEEDITTYKLDDVKERVSKIIQKKNDLVGNKPLANKLASQDVYTALEKAGANFIRNDINPTKQQLKEKVVDVLSEKYPELKNDSAEPSPKTTKEIDDNTSEEKPINKKENKDEEKKIDSTKEKALKAYEFFKPYSNYEKAIQELKEEGKTTDISFDDVKLALGKCINKAIIKLYDKNKRFKKYVDDNNIKNIEDFDTFAFKFMRGEATIIRGMVPEILKEDYPDIYKLIYDTGDNLKIRERRKKREEKKKEAEEKKKRDDFAKNFS